MHVGDLAVCNESVLQVSVAAAELFWEQIKTRKKSTGSLSKVQQPFSSKSTDDLFAFLDGSLTEEDDSFICILIHNIDGPGSIAACGAVLLLLNWCYFGAK